MSIYRVSDFIAYDHEIGAFMFYFENGDMRLLPQHYITRVEALDESVNVVCDTKHLKEQFSVRSKQPNEDVEKISYILEEF